MRRPNEIAREEASMATLTQLTSSFEGIASMRIAQIKNQVLQSTKFFNALWAIYSHMHVAGHFKFGRTEATMEINKELYIIITAEGGFSGDIDQRVVQFMLQSFDPEKTDIVVIGRHGASQLSQRNIAYKKYFNMPTKDRNINVGPVIREVQKYRSTTLFYPEYKSLMQQEVRHIELSTAVQQRGDASAAADAGISERTYIFEPSAHSVAAHLERSMMRIAISQLILESKLAEYASRFRAMSASHERAEGMRQELRLSYNKARRNAKDERLKEIINGLKKTKAGAKS